MTQIALIADVCHDCGRDLEGLNAWHVRLPSGEVVDVCPLHARDYVIVRQRARRVARRR